MLTSGKVRYWLATGYMDEINNWADAHPIIEESDFNFPGLLDLTILARAWIALERISPAISLLDHLQAIAQSKELDACLVEINLLRSLCLLKNGEIGKAVVYFDDCLHRGMNEGFFRIFIDAGSPIRQIIEEYHHQILNGSRQPAVSIRDYLEKIEGSV
jgi:hypothetical protein